MKATVQYNDFTGTVAADISDYFKNSVQFYLSEKYKHYDSNRYMCRGCDIYLSGQDSIATIEFICYDNEENCFVSFCPEELTLSDIIYLFKRLSIVMGKEIDTITPEKRLDLE